MVVLRRLLGTALICWLAGSAGAASQGKKVYISVDMEGISGINGDDQTTAGDGLFAFRFPVPASVMFQLSLRHSDLSERSGSWHDLALGSDVDLGDVVLLPQVEVTGRVVDTRGRPQGGVRIEVHREIGDDERRAAVSSHNHDKHGDAA